jgi:hypothetical protein
MTEQTLGPAPTIGRIVHYTLSEDDAKAIHKRRSDAAGLHIGNAVDAGDVFPMMITRVWGDTPESAVNGQVLLDGTDVLWACSVQQGTGPRTWCWPPRV